MYIPVLILVIIMPFTYTTATAQIFTTFSIFISKFYIICLLCVIIFRIVFMVVRTGQREISYSSNCMDLRI